MSSMQAFQDGHSSGWNSGYKSGYDAAWREANERLEKRQKDFNEADKARIARIRELELEVAALKRQ